MTAGATYEPIARTTFTGAESTVTFSSIASTWTDLRVVFNGTVSTSTSARLRFNGDTASNYMITIIYGDGAGAACNSFGSNYLNLSWAKGIHTSIPAVINTDIFSYAGSTFKNMISTMSNDQVGTGAQSTTTGIWKSTSAITSIEFYAGAGTFNSGSTVTLYGIAKA